jgi:hypothetical protein
VRRIWVQVVLAAGLAVVVIEAIAAAGHEGLAREDSFRASVAALLLLGGLVVALGLGSTAMNVDAQNGHLGMLRGAGATRAELVLAAVGARLATLVAVLAAWGVAAQAGSAALGLGLDGPLAVHTLAVAETLALTLLAAAAASSIVSPVPAGAFGGMIFVAAQAAVNLKAAADQNLIGTADNTIDVLYYLVPRAVVSPMIAALQLRDRGGAAAPTIDINGNDVFVPAATGATVIWTIAWCLVFAIACGSGFRRRTLS